MSGASGGKPPPKPPPGHSAIWGPTGTRRKSTSRSTGPPSYSKRQEEYSLGQVGESGRLNF